jgi:hypothetical protein
MKRAVVLTLVVILLALNITPALAEGDQNQHQYRFQLTGVVEDVDVAAGAITVSVIGYAPGNPTSTERLTIQTTERTEFSYARGANATEVRPPTIEDVTVGEKIAVRGIVQEQVHIATQVILRLQANTPTPTPTPPDEIHFSLMGDVKAIDLDAGAITVKVIAYSANIAITLWPEELVIQTNERTEFRWARPDSSITPNPPTLEDVEIGERIAVRGMIQERVHIATMVMLRYNQPTATPMPRFALTGSVESVDTEAGTIDVSVITYAPPQPSDTQRILTIQVTNETRFMWAPPASSVDPAPPTIEDVEVGAKISVHGIVRDDEHVALQILLRNPNVTPAPTRTPGTPVTPGPWRTPTAQPQNID